MEGFDDLAIYGLLVFVLVAVDGDGLDEGVVDVF